MGPVVLYLMPLPDPLRRRYGIDRPALRRLRAALKMLKRRYGLRCVMLREPTGWEIREADGSAERQEENGTRMTQDQTADEEDRKPGLSSDPRSSAGFHLRHQREAERSVY